MKITKRKLKEYSDAHAIKEVLGSFMNKPSLMKEYPTTKKDFPEAYHQLIFATINNLYKKGAEVIDAVAIDEYLSNYEKHYRTFTKAKGMDFVQDVAELAQPMNIKYYHSRLRKFTAIRRYASKGQDVSFFFDPDETDEVTLETQRLNLEKHTIPDIVKHYKKLHLEVSSEFVMKEGRDSKKAGVGGREQLEKWKKSTAWGHGYSSAYMTTIFHGCRKRRFVVKSAGTGVGKTRTTISDIGYIGAPALYDKTLGKWIKNPNGVSNGVLYIGTEMELLEEIDPILWAYMADVSQEKIEFATYTDEEEQRVIEAIRMLEDEANIWLEYLPEYDSSQLEEVIEEHKLEHNIEHVFFDYIHTTVELLSEFADQSKVKMTVREDQVLANLSNKLKGLTRRYDISLDTCTQVSGNFKDESNRDSTIVRGAKAIIDKADGSLIAMPPTEVELKKIEPIINELSREGIGEKIVPNLCYSFYKNRGGKYNMVKVWLYIDYDTMRTYDLFVTDYEYHTDSKRLEGLEKTYINISEDKVDSKESSANEEYIKKEPTNELEDIY